MVPSPYRRRQLDPFTGLEALEPRVHADAAPFPTLAAAPPSGPVVPGQLIFDGGGGGGADPLPSAEWDNGHALMGLTQMWADPRFSRYHGAGLRTVILDTGINVSSPFFGPDNNGDGIADRIVYQYDFADRDANASDTLGHGSNVAAAAASSDEAFGGVAADAGIIALRVFDDAGAGNFMLLERGLQWVVANAARYNIASVNMSLGDGLFWEQAVTLYNVGDELAALAAMGVIVTAAAGNGFYDGGSRQGLSYPAADPSVIAVGAVYGQSGPGFAYAGGAQADTTPAGAVAPFSQRGPLIGVMAPGAPIVGPDAGLGLSVMHGTSQAAPQIAGLAVLAQQMAGDLLGRRLSVAEFRSLLTSTARTVIDGDDEDDNVEHDGAGYPLVDALALADAIWSMRVQAARSQNTAPTLAGVDALTGAIAGRGAVISYDTLSRAAHPADAEGDPIWYRVDGLGAGQLTISGRPASVGATIRPSDNVVWTPDPGSAGQQTAFSIRASDGALTSDASWQVVIGVSDAPTPGYWRGVRLASDGPLDGPAGGGRAEPHGGLVGPSAGVEAPGAPRRASASFITWAPARPHAPGGSPLTTSALLAVDAPPLAA